MGIADYSEVKTVILVNIYQYIHLVENKLLSTAYLVLLSQRLWSGPLIRVLMSSASKAMLAEGTFILSENVYAIFGGITKSSSLYIQNMFTLFEVVLP